MATTESSTVVQYNGYTFNNFSHVTVNAEMVTDDADRTVIYHRHRLRVQTTLVAEPGDANVGRTFTRLRQLLSKQGRQLIINHAAWGPYLSVNSSNSQQYDSAFGPKPRIITWEPVGATNAIDVVWECEFCLPTCDGQSGVKYEGIAALNYSVSYNIDHFGYTNRTVSGYLEIALTRRGNSVRDSADAYRDQIKVPKPVNFERQSNFTLSTDKRRLDFTVTDSEIQSPNAYPDGVVKIRANHRASWNRRNSANVMNAISATIELAHNKPRGYSWEIFKALVSDRTQVAKDAGDFVMLEALQADEELYGHSISFDLTYRIISSEESGALEGFFTSTGLFREVADWQQWNSWSKSLEQIQSQRGLSGLTHKPANDPIVDLCVNAIPPTLPDTHYVQQPPQSGLRRLCNPKPPPNKSYVKFEADLTSIEDVPTTLQITLGKDDLENREFDPSDVNPTNGSTDQSQDIERFIEEAPAGILFRWRGYAERLGYEIPKPGKLTFGNVELTRYGEQKFRSKYLGKFFCQPLYGASWDLTYYAKARPLEVSTRETDPINTSGAS